MQLPDDLRTHLEAEYTALQALEAAEGVAPDHLRFCEKLARFQASARAIIRATRPPAEPPIEDRTDPPTTDDRRLHRDALLLDQDLLLQLLDRIKEIAAPPSPEEDHLQRLVTAAREDPALLEEVAAAAFGGDARPLQVIGERIGLAPPALLMVGRLLVSPFVIEARYARDDLPEMDARSLEPQQAIRCPTCGSAPALAILGRDEGTRRFWCSLCTERWIVPRLMCPGCGTRDASHLATLQMPQNPSRWVETCDGCRRYIKTVDQQQLPYDHLLVEIAEDAATLHLDLMAEQAGFVRPAF